jgi:putative DNA primase/helicase
MAGAAMSARREDWIARARAVPIYGLIRRHRIQLRGSGVELVGPCPRCGGDDRFSINTTKNVWNCRQCSKGGDVIDLEMFLNGGDFNAACEKLTGEPPPKSNGKARGAARKVVVAQYDYFNVDGALHYAVERIKYQKQDGSFIQKDGKDDKTFRQKRPDPQNPKRWIFNLDGVERLPYRVSELIEAIGNGQTIFIPEGEECVDALRQIDVPATCNSEGAEKWKPELAQYFRDADVVLLPDNDEPGFRHINQVGATLTGVAKRIRVLILPDLRPKGDIAEWLAAGNSRERFDELAAQAPEWQPPAADSDGKGKAEEREKELIDQLAQLGPLEFDRQRDSAARELRIRRGTLDDAVEARRAERTAEAGPPPLFGHWVVEPWEEPVDTDALLLAVVRRLQRHVVFTSAQATTVALWILFAWAHDAAATHSPLLLVTSVEANSGKTTLLLLISYLTPRALVCVEISEATLFRGVELWQPTIIVDEADVILINNEPLRAVVNSGWTRGSCVPRCIGDANVPHAFPTFCPKAIGMKGRKLPDTTLSRSIIIELKRRHADDKVEHFRALDDAGLADLRRQALRWANDNAEGLKNVEPEMPPGFQNRLGDNWRLLLAIADLAGGDWPDKAREAAKALSNVVDVSSARIRLLAAFRLIFSEAGGSADFLASDKIVAKLTAEADAEWTEWKSGKPITQTQLARLLEPFGIAPHRHQIEGERQRGYFRSHFEEAWKLYLPPENGL